MNKKYAELDFPAWFDGKDVNEAAFCREFLSKNKLIYADNAFFTPDGRLTGPLLLKEKIYAEPECCAAKNIPRTISNIVEIMKLAAHAESFPPKPDEIHVQNGTLRIDGSFLAGRPEIVRSRFPVAYNPQAEKPVVWLRFLSDLLYPEDIPTFQEYMQEVVDLLHDEHGWSDSISNLSNKLQRESLRYVEAVQLADALGYEIVWQRKKS